MRKTRFLEVHFVEGNLEGLFRRTVDVASIASEACSLSKNALYGRR